MLVNALSFVTMIQPVGAPPRPPADKTSAPQDGTGKPFSRLLDTQAGERRDGERKAAAAAADSRAAAARAADRRSTPAPDVVYHEPPPRPAPVDTDTDTDAAEQAKAADGKAASAKKSGGDDSRPDSARAARQNGRAARGGDAAADAAAAGAAAAAGGRPTLAGPGDRPVAAGSGGCFPADTETETDTVTDPDTQPICDAVPLALLAGMPGATATGPAATASGTSGTPADSGTAALVDTGLPPTGGPASGTDRSTRRPTAGSNASDRVLPGHDDAHAPGVSDKGLAAMGLKPPSASTASAASAASAAGAVGADNAAAADAVKSFAAELQALLPAGSAGAAPLGGTAAYAATAATAGAGAPADMAVEGRLSASPGTPEFAGALGAQLSTFVAQGVHHARLELNPAEMGPVTVQIQLDGQNAQVRLAAENADTRRALEQAMPELAGSLREAGLTLSGGGVYEQPQPQSQAQQQSGGSGQRDLRTGGNSAQNTAAVGGAGGNVRPDTGLPERRRGVVDLVA